MCVTNDAMKKVKREAQGLEKKYLTHMYDVSVGDCF